MDLWNRARMFAEEAGKRSQEISMEAAKRSQELTRGAADLVSKKSREIADEILTEAIRRADQIKTTIATTDIPSLPLSVSSSSSAAPVAGKEMMKRFGVTDELREFVKGITISTFRDFPIQDEPETSQVPTASNVRLDLNEWQAKHATLVLSSVKEISKFRYELCPRYMKERKFWRIYFILVNNYVALYEKQYFEDLEKKAREINDKEKKDGANSLPASKDDKKDSKLQSKSSTAEQDLDVFLLGDLGSSDDEPDITGDSLDDDFDKIENASGLESEEDEKKSKAMR